MLFGPHEIARRFEYRHRPGWSVWYGAKTRQYWAVACWLRPGGMLGADTSEALEAAIGAFEVLQPKPSVRSHALGD
jgi:hypothetical protein